MGTAKNRIPRKDFAGIFKMEIPFNASSEEEKQHQSYTRSMSWRRRRRACCSAERPEVLFFAPAISMQISFVWSLEIGQILDGNAM
jgi:hypothetical protein